MLDAIDFIVDALDAIKWWRVAVCALLALVITAAAHLTVGEPMVRSAFVAAGVLGAIVGVLWEAVAGLSRWLRS